MLTQAVTRAIDEGKERVWGHGLKETGRNKTQRLWPYIWSLMHALNITNGHGNGGGNDEKAEMLKQTQAKHESLVRCLVHNFLYIRKCVSY